MTSFHLSLWQRETFHQHDFSCLHTFTKPETSLSRSYTTSTAQLLSMLAS